MKLEPKHVGMMARHDYVVTANKILAFTRTGKVVLESTDGEAYSFDNDDKWIIQGPEKKPSEVIRAQIKRVLEIDEKCSEFYTFEKAVLDYLDSQWEEKKK